MRQLKIETGDNAELQAAMIELVIQHVAAAAAVVGNEVFVIASHADALHVIGRAEADQRAAPLMEREGRLLFYRFQHWAVRPFLTRYGASFDMAELTIDPHRAEQVRRGDLFIDALVQLRLGDRPIELLADAGLEKGDDGERGFLLQTGRAGAAVGAQLVYFLIERDQFAIQMIEGAEAEIAVFQQFGDGGLPS